MTAKNVASSPGPTIRVGVSSCLLGQRVRYDGGHKHDPYLTGTLGQYFEWVPVCPEDELGLGTPRESLRLVGSVDSVRMVFPRSGRDITDEMQKFATKRVQALARMDLHGYIFKKDSPSCGVFRVRVYPEKNGPAARTGRGLFTAAVAARLPLLPLEEEGRLHDPGLRESFVERVFAHHRWTSLRTGRPRARDLVAFHTAHKMSLMAHSRKHYEELGRLVAAAGRENLAARLDRYGEVFMEALTVRATRRKHANVLQHLTGYLKRELDAGDRAELRERIEEYRLGRVPLVVPLTLLAHHFRRHPVDWVMSQVYLNPYPAELMLRNSV